MRVFFKLPKDRFVVYIFIILISFTLITFLNTRQVYAASCSWNGSVSGNWNTAGNWDAGCTGAGGIPGDTDLLTFPIGASNQTMNNDIAGLAVGELIFQTSGYSLSGNDITLNNGVISSSATTSVSLNITLGGDQIFQAGSYSGDINTNGHTLSFDNTNGDVNASGNISGISGGLVQLSGNNLTTISGTNVFTGYTEVVGGNMRLSNNSAAGDASNIVTVRNGTTLTIAGGDYTIPNDIELDGTSNLVSQSSINTLTGNIAIAVKGYINVQANQLILSGVISGGAITNIGPGTLTISGTSSNTFTGNFETDDGIVEITKDNPAIALSGNVIVGDGTGATNSAQLTMPGGSEQILDTASVTVNSDAIWLFNSNGETIDSVVVNNGGVYTGGGSFNLNQITMTGGTIDSSSGSINLTTRIDAGSDATQAIISGNLNYDTNNITINSTGGPINPGVSITAIIDGSGAINYTGSTIELGGNNTYTGTSIVTCQLSLIANNGLGASSANTQINNDGSVVLNNDIQVPESFVLNGDGNSIWGALNGGNGSNIVEGNISLGADSKIGIESDQYLEIDGNITGAHNLTYAMVNGINQSFLGLFDVGSYTGSTTIENNVQASPESGDAIPDNYPLIINTGGILDMSDEIETVGTLSGNGNIISGQDLTINNSADSTYSGVITDATFGPGNILKTGNGILTLTGNSSSYTGILRILAGKLFVDGNNTQDPVSIEGGTLGGTGTVNSVTGTSGYISPGHSPGVIHLSSDLVLNSSTNTVIEVNGSTVGTDYDQIDVTGNVTLGNSPLNVSVGFSPILGQVFTIVQFTGTLTGTFDNLANNDTITSGGVLLRINYNSNTVTLTVVEVSLSETGIRIPVSIVSGAMVLSIVGLGILNKKKLKLFFANTSIYRKIN